MQSNVKSRLIEFLKFKSISQKAFAQSVGVSAGFVNAIRVSIQPKTLEKISNVYPDLNITWLLTGVGPMLLDVAPPAQVSSVNSAVAMHGNAINTITNE
ncbi:MAG: helix-turn-helix transcriptional regulator, partial [Prevotellamassilia sp.]|nr:helix-turn-helix transcriptional regulator [Prevotellamassilia sp.]